MTSVSLFQSVSFFSFAFHSFLISLPLFPPWKMLKFDVDLEVIMNPFCILYPNPIAIVTAHSWAPPQTTLVHHSLFTFFIHSRHLHLEDSGSEDGDLGPCMCWACALQIVLHPIFLLDSSVQYPSQPELNLSPTAINWTVTYAMNGGFFFFEKHSKCTLFYPGVVAYSCHPRMYKV